MGTTRFWGIALLAMVMFISACSAKYSDAIEVNTQFGEAAEAYIDGMDKAKNADDVTETMDAFAAAMEKLGPRMKEIADKYPELKDPDNLPKELKESREKVDAIGMKIGGAMFKTMKYMNNPKVMAAQKRLQKAMTKMK